MPECNWHRSIAITMKCALLWTACIENKLNSSHFISCQDYQNIRKIHKTTERSSINCDDDDDDDDDEYYYYYYYYYYYSNY